MLKITKTAKHTRETAPNSFGNLITRHYEDQIVTVTGTLEEIVWYSTKHDIAVERSEAAAPLFRGADEDVRYAIVNNRDVASYADNRAEISGFGWYIHRAVVLSDDEESTVWYCIVNDADDNDWGTGSCIREEANTMLREALNTYPDARLLVIKDEVCEAEIIPDKDQQPITDIQSTAAALYDGGWRSSDRDQLVAEYVLTSDEADAICDKLAEFESNTNS